MAPMHNGNKKDFKVKQSERHIASLRTLFGVGAIAVCSAIYGTFFSGCSTQSCLDNRSAVPTMGFYSSSTQTQVTLSHIELGGIGAPNDSLLVADGESCSSVTLPFRADYGETSFRIHYNYTGLESTALDDIITFYYTSQPYFASEECGAYYRYRITKVDYTRHLIDSLVVTDSLITNVDLERIKVYFRTATIEDSVAAGSDDTTTDSSNGEDSTSDGTTDSDAVDSDNGEEVSA